MSNKVAVLLATYNGEKYLREQLRTIEMQTHENWHLFIRDDGSTDATVDIIKEFSSRFSNTTIVDNFGEFTGSAAGNFFKLLNFSDFEGFSHISLADQDDIWAPTKLESALSHMSLVGAGGYSSNLVSYDNTSFRANYIDKSQPQKKFDFIFQGASAGCTYVFTRETCLLIQKKTINIDSFKGRSHDWLIYALCRTNDIPWVFDQEAHIFYRQHAGNVFGSMSAFAGLVARLKLLRSGWYRENVLWIAEKSGADAKASAVVDRIKRNSLMDKISLAKTVSQFRRSNKESKALVFIIFLFF
ncbi:glycosyltransferase [Pseudomonas sp. FSL R10-0399]|uniref:glycosyltransferase n=1 Tax=unclassified Pseudomonas TaxID=196821 RepID=UPI0015B653D8